MSFNRPGLNSRGLPNRPRPGLLGGDFQRLFTRLPNQIVTGPSFHTSTQLCPAVSRAIPLGPVPEVTARLSDSRTGDADAGGGIVSSTSTKPVSAGNDVSNAPGRSLSWTRPRSPADASLLPEANLPDVVKAHSAPCTPVTLETRFMMPGDSTTKQGNGPSGGDDGSRDPDLTKPTSNKVLKRKRSEKMIRQKSVEIDNDIVFVDEVSPTSVQAPPQFNRQISDKGQKNRQHFSGSSSGFGSQPDESSSMESSQDGNGHDSFESGFGGGAGTFSRQVSRATELQPQEEEEEEEDEGDKPEEQPEGSETDTIQNSDLVGGDASFIEENSVPSENRSTELQLQDGDEGDEDMEVMPARACANSESDVFGFNASDNEESAGPSANVNTLRSMDNEFAAVMQQQSPPQSHEWSTTSQTEMVAGTASVEIAESPYALSPNAEVAGPSGLQSTAPTGILPKFEEMMRKEDSDSEEMNVLPVPRETQLERRFIELYQHTFCEEVNKMQDEGCSPQQIKTFVEYYTKILPSNPMEISPPMQYEAPSPEIQVYSPEGAASGVEIPPHQDFSSTSRHHSDEITLQYGDLLRSLQSAYQCQRRDCRNQLCIMGQDLLDQIESSLRKNRAYWEGHIREILIVLFQHAQDCVECTCTVPYCTYFHRCTSDFDNSLRTLHNINLYGQNTLIEPPTINDRLVQLTDNPPEIPLGTPHRMPECRVSYEVLSTTGRFNPCDRFFVKAATVDALYMNINRMSHETEQVLSYLRAPHDHVIQHLWAIHNSRDLLVFQLNAGDTLSAFLRNQYHNGLDLYQMWIVLDHLLQGACYLMDRGIQFVNWNSEAITINMNCARLTDFSCALLVTAGLDEDRVTDARMLMCPQVIPPELFHGSVALGLTDAWGAGVVAVEMTSGRMLHDELRHDNPEQARNQVDPGRRHTVPVLLNFVHQVLIHIHNTASTVPADQQRR